MTRAARQGLAPRATMPKPEWLQKCSQILKQIMKMQQAWVRASRPARAPHAPRPGRRPPSLATADRPRGPVQVFLEPVDPIKLGIPDYHLVRFGLRGHTPRPPSCRSPNAKPQRPPFRPSPCANPYGPGRQVITNPMDFGTIKKMLDAGQARPAPQPPDRPCTLRETCYRL
jgi:hypothetical protein